MTLVLSIHRKSAVSFHVSKKPLAYGKMGPKKISHYSKNVNSIEEAIINGQTANLERFYKAASFKRIFEKESLFFLEISTKIASPKSLEWLLEKAIIKDSRLALKQACENKNIEAVKALLKRGADPFQTLDDEGYTALHMAAYHGDQDLLDLVLSHCKTDQERRRVLAQTERDGLNVMMIAASKAPISMLKKILSLWKNPTEKKSFLNHQSIDGTTALMLTVYRNDKVSLDYLIRQGADFSKVDREGMTVLHIAAMANFHEIIDALAFYLKTRKGKELLNSKDSSGKTPVMVAKFEGSIDFKQKLLDLGADQEGLQEIKILEPKKCLLKRKENEHWYKRDIVSRLIARALDSKIYKLPTKINFLSGAEAFSVTILKEELKFIEEFIQKCPEKDDQDAMKALKDSLGISKKIMINLDQRSYNSSAINGAMIFIQNQLDSMKTGESFLLSGGYTIPVSCYERGHQIGYIITKQANKKFTLEICNRGDGADKYHEGKKYIHNISLKGLTKANIAGNKQKKHGDLPRFNSVESYGILGKLFQFCVHGVDENSRVKESDPLKVLYDVIKGATSKTLQKSSFHKAQVKGSCSDKVLRAFTKDYLIRHFKRRRACKNPENRALNLYHRYKIHVHESLHKSLQELIDKAQKNNQSHIEIVRNMPDFDFDHTLTMTYDTWLTERQELQSGREKTYDIPFQYINPMMKASLKVLRKRERKLSKTPS